MAFASGPPRSSLDTVTAQRVSGAKGKAKKAWKASCRAASCARAVWDTDQS